MESIAPQTYLPNAPIREAILDIRAELPVDTTIETIDGLYAQIRAEYPKKQTKRWIKSTLNLDSDDPAIIDAVHGVAGFLFLNDDATQVAQFRLDGFSFSRLAPYKTWDEFFEEAKRLWRIYASGVHPESTTRVAVRYINQLTIPVGEKNWREYLRVPPALLPQGISHPVSEFLTRYSATDIESKHTCTVTLAMQPINDSTNRTILLDIDTFKLEEFRDEDHIWDTAKLLRKAKNTLFFGTLSDDALELCK